jgi:hypothetical protein
MLFKIICFSIEIMNWIALYFLRSLSSNQITDISPQVFEGLSTFSLLSEFHVVMFATISGNKQLSPNYSNSISSVEKASNKR